MAIESLGIAALMRRQRTLRREGTSSSSSIYYNAAFHLCRSLSNISLPWLLSAESECLLHSSSMTHLKLMDFTRISEISVQAVL